MSKLTNAKQKFYSKDAINGMSGPSTFSFFKLPNNRRILMLGEDINLGKSCKDSGSETEMHSWITSLLDNSNNCIDLFVESEYKDEVKGKLSNLFGLTNSKPNPVKEQKIMRKYTERSEHDFENPLDSVKKTFSACDSLNSRACPFENLRYHSIDVRTIDGCNSELLQFFSSEERIEFMFSKFKQLNAGFEDLKVYEMENFRELLGYFSGLDRSKGSGDIAKIYLSKLNKFIPIKLKDVRNYRSKYLSLIDDQIKHIKGFNKEKFFESLYQASLLFENVSTDKSQMWDFYTKLMFSPMDTYFLLGFLRTYSTNNLTVTKCKHGNEEHLSYVILQAGSHHTLVYYEFFKSYFEVEAQVHIKNDPHNNCVSFDEPFNYFMN